MEKGLNLGDFFDVNPQKLKLFTSRGIKKRIVPTRYIDILKSINSIASRDYFELKSSRQIECLIDQLLSLLIACHQWKHDRTRK